MRMDKYKNDDDMRVMSRSIKNQDMYKDVYLNNTLVSIDTLKKDDDIKPSEVVPMVPTYVEKNYNVNDYLDRAHGRKVNDNLKRSLDNTDCEVNKVRDKEDEISKLIDSIEKKDKEEDFFGDLLPDDDNTVVTDPVDETKLNQAIDDELLYSYTESSYIKKETEDEFQDVLDDEKPRSHVSKLPVIICSSTFIVLVIVIIIIVAR